MAKISREQMDKGIIHRKGMLPVHAKEVSMKEWTAMFGINRTILDLKAMKDFSVRHA